MQPNARTPKHGSPADVTHEAEASDAIETSALLQSLESTLAVGVVDWIEDTERFVLSEGAWALLDENRPGTPRETDRFLGMAELLSAVARESAREVAAFLREGGIDISTPPDGIRLPQGQELSLQRAANPPAGRSRWILRNVTREKAKEDDRLDREQTMLKLLGMAEVGTWILDLATNELEWSDEVFRIHGLPLGATPSVEEAITFYPPEAADRVRAGLENSIAGGGPYNLELPLHPATGGSIWIHARGDVEHAPDGTPLRICGTVQDVTARHEAEFALRASEERLQLALDGARDGVWDWNLETDEVHLSPRWKEIIGYEDHELANDLSEWASRVPEKERAHALERIERCVRGETKRYRTEFPMRHKDGSTRWILARGRAMMRDDTGHATRMIGTHTDITDHVELQAELRRARDAAEAAAHAKSEFLATMSHEIRTPMNGVLGLARVLLDTPLDHDQREYVESIHGSGSALLAILNDILDLSKAEAGKLELESIPMDPAKCAQDVLQLLRIEVESKGHVELGLRVSDDVPSRVMGDPGRLRQVLMNLMGNAVKFTPEGRVDIELSATPDGESRSLLRIAVRDTGIGIKPEQRERLFEAFTQADASTTRKFGGTGLGLSISLHLASRMNGTLDCAPNGEQGTVFWIEIPVQHAAEDASQNEDGHDPADEVRSAGQRVLVAEDNAVNQLVSRKLLEKLGFEVTIAVNGQEAVEMTAAVDYDIVFMDCQMPVMDGYEATRQIRARSSSQRTRRIPIIAMTANALAGDRKRCIAAGMDDYVGKPIVHDELIAAIKRHEAIQRAV